MGEVWALQKLPYVPQVEVWALHELSCTCEVHALRELPCAACSAKGICPHMTVEHLLIMSLQCAHSQSVADFMLKRGKAASVGLVTFITYIHEFIKNLQ